MENEKTIVLGGFKLSPELKRRFDSAARARGMTLADASRNALEAFCLNYEQHVAETALAHAQAMAIALECEAAGDLKRANAAREIAKTVRALPEFAAYERDYRGVVSE